MVYSAWSRPWHGKSLCALVCIVFLSTGSTVMAADLSALWDFSDPALSEQRFTAALESAVGDDSLILKTQIARSYGLRKEFEKARDLLLQIEEEVNAAGAEARVRYALELGRTYASATHPPESQSEENRNQARAAFKKALAIARSAQLDRLAIDAVHMMAFLDTKPADQLKWAKEALALVNESSQPDARRWEASIRNNLGYALHQLGQYEEALTEFNKAVEIRERGTNVKATRVAHWMVAWTLRALNRQDEALEILLRLEHENASAGKPDPFVFEELEILYRERGNEEAADRYANLKASHSK